MTEITLGWLIISRLAIFLIICLVIYEVLQHQKELYYKDKEAIFGLILIGIFLEFVIVFATPSYGMDCLGRGLTWMMYNIGMLISKTFNIVTKTSSQDDE